MSPARGVARASERARGVPGGRRLDGGRRSMTRTSCRLAKEAGILPCRIDENEPVAPKAQSV